MSQARELADYTVDDAVLARKVLSRLGINADANEYRVAWVADEICRHREGDRRSEATDAA